MLSLTTLVRIGFAVVLSMSCCRGEEVRVLSVCEILDHLENFSCRMVRVKGRLSFGLDSWLTGEACPKKFEVDNVAFESMIKVTWPSSVLVGCQVDFETDLESREKIVDAYKSVDPKRQRVDLVIDGVIETRNPPYALVRKKPSPKIGFGDHGSAPAQIITKRLVHIDITPLK